MILIRMAFYGLINKTPEYTYSNQHTGVWVASNGQVVVGEAKSALGGNGIKVFHPYITGKTLYAEMKIGIDGGHFQPDGS